jgi:hypothetical protein
MWRELFENKGFAICAFYQTILNRSCCPKRNPVSPITHESNFYILNLEQRVRGVLKRITHGKHASNSSTLVGGTCFRRGFAKFGFVPLRKVILRLVSL